MTPETLDVLRWFTGFICGLVCYFVVYSLHVVWKVRRDFNESMQTGKFTPTPSRHATDDRPPIIQVRVPGKLQRGVKRRDK